MADTDGRIEKHTFFPKTTTNPVSNHAQNSFIFVPNTPETGALWHGVGPWKGGKFLKFLATFFLSMSI